MDVFVAVIHWSGTNVGEEDVATFPDIVSAQAWVDRKLPDEDEGDDDGTRWDIVKVTFRGV